PECRVRTSFSKRAVLMNAGALKSSGAGFQPAGGGCGGAPALRHKPPRLEACATAEPARMEHPALHQGALSKSGTESAARPIARARLSLATLKANTPLMKS